MRAEMLIQSIRGRAIGIQRLKENYFLICWAPLLIAGGDNEKSPQKYLN